jgi:hypothetical protein
LNLGARIRDGAAGSVGLKAGLRSNGAPYSANALLSEYYDSYTAPNGDELLVVTSIVENPQYLSQPFVTSSNFKKLPDSTGWNPTPCSAK